MRFPALLCAAALVAPSLASAEDMDLALSRLSIEAMDGTDCSRTTSDGGPPRDFCGDDENWARLMSQWGIAFAPPILAPARTLGVSGLYVGLDVWVTGIDSKAEYWQLGTEGDASSGEERRNRFTTSTLFWQRLNVRKGLPFGFELGTSLSHQYKTEMWALGVDLKWAPFEGFRTGIGYLPDLAVRGAVNTLTGDSDIQAVVPALDIMLSKPLVIGQTVTLSPYMAAQMIWLIIDSELVDLTPGVDAFAECLPSGGELMCDDDAMPLDGREPGQDFNNNYIFNDIRARRTRIAFGLQLEYALLVVNGSFMIDLVPPSNGSSEIPGDLPQQWTFAFGAGLKL